MRKRSGRVSAAWVGGAVFSLLAAFGRQIERWGRSDPPRALLLAAALFVPASLLLGRLFRIRLPEREGARPFSARRAFLFMLLCWTPSFLVHFPGSFAYDVPFQLEQTASGLYSTHHPLAHTLLLGGCVRLGRAFGNVNAGAALYTVLQMALLAGCFSLCCASLRRQAGPRAARIAAAAFALYPFHMLMAVNATKDTLFSGCFALTLALLREALTGDPGAFPPGRRAALFAVAALSVLLRNNFAWALGVYLLFLLAARRFRACALLALALSCAVGAGQIMAFALRAVPGDPREMLSWPIQQMARVSCLERERLDDGEKALIDAVLPGMAWKRYDPTVSDPVKFEFRTDRLKEAPGRYAALCLSLAKKCPGCSLDAVLALTHAYLYPYGRYGVSGAYLQTGVTEAVYSGWTEEETIRDASLFPAARRAVAWRFGAQGAMQFPVVGFFFNLGVITWCMLFFALRSFAEGRPGEGLSALLPLLLLGTFLLGPVMAGRYAYAFVSALPVMWTRARTPRERTGNDEA